MYLQVPEYPVFLGTALALPEGLQPEHFQPETNNSTLSISLYVYIYTPSSLPLYYNICMCVYIYIPTPSTSKTDRRGVAARTPGKPSKSLNPQTHSHLKPLDLPGMVHHDPWEEAGAPVRSSRVKGCSRSSGLVEIIGLGAADLRICFEEACYGYEGSGLSGLSEAFI